MTPDLQLNPLALVVLVPVLNGLGRLLKRTPAISNHTIPWIVTAAGALGYPILAGWTGEAVLIGLLLGQMAVGLHQTVRQSQELLKP